jgi:hypothetical protein
LQGANLTLKQKTDFLSKLYKSMGDVSQACRAAGVSRAAIYAHRKNDAGFAEAWNDVRESLRNAIPTELYRRGRKGKKFDTSASEKYRERNKSEKPVKSQKEGYLYLVWMRGTSFFKIGFSMQPESRVKGLQTASPLELILVGITLGDVFQERRFHRVLEPYRGDCEGEWFDLPEHVVWGLMSIFSYHLAEGQTPDEWRKFCMLRKQKCLEKMKKQASKPATSSQQLALFA